MRARTGFRLHKSNTSMERLTIHFASKYIFISQSCHMIHSLHLPQWVVGRGHHNHLGPLRSSCQLFAI